MFPSTHDLRRELRPMLTLAIPVVVAELGWVTMGMVDTLMVGRISPAAIGAVGIGSSLFLAVGVFAMGLLLGLDTLVSQAFGARRLDECHGWLVHGVVLALVLTVPVMAILWTLRSTLDAWSLHPDVLPLAGAYLETVTWSVLPLLLYAAFRRYLQGIGVVRPVMIALVLANIMNAIINWILIFGHFGAPAMGVRGAAWATVTARAVMALSLFGVIVYREHLHMRDVPFRIDVARMRRLLTLGFPAAMQLTLEVGGFAAATALAGRLAPASLAAHQIALNIAGFTFMIPLGISSAGAVRVGHAVGRRDPEGVRRAGWTALLLGASFMLCAAAFFVTVPRVLIGAFTADEAVLAIGASLLLVAAVFQLFDGLQGVATGVLRGLGDTRSPMIWNLAGHWAIGLPLGYALAFVAGLGVVGLWWGLSTGLIICGVALLVVWMRHLRVRRDRRD
jgi:MATE family, multidrug efflux pump